MNKILVSIIFAVILIIGINKITDSIFYVEKPEQSAYQVESVTSVASTKTSEPSSESSGSENIMALIIAFCKTRSLLISSLFAHPQKRRP